MCQYVSSVVHHITYTTQRLERQRPCNETTNKWNGYDWLNAGSQKMASSLEQRHGFRKDASSSIRIQSVKRIITTLYMNCHGLSYENLYDELVFSSRLSSTTSYTHLALTRLLPLIRFHSRPAPLPFSRRKSNSCYYRRQIASYQVRVLSREAQSRPIRLVALPKLCWTCRP